MEICRKTIISFTLSMNCKMISLSSVLFFNVLFGLNYSVDISPIIYNNCTSCHRSGEIGAFLPLTNYANVYDNIISTEKKTNSRGYISRLLTRKGKRSLGEVSLVAF